MADENVDDIQQVVHVGEQVDNASTENDDIGGQQDIIPDDTVTGNINAVRALKRAQAQQEPDDAGDSVMKKPRYDLEHIVSEDDELKWDLPTELAEFFTLYTKQHVGDSDLKKQMKHFPIPENVSCVPTLDANLRTTLRKEGSNSAVELDDDLATIQKKVQDIIGPL